MEAEVKGIIVNKRSLSKKLVFFDLEYSDCLERDTAGLELMVKTGIKGAPGVTEGEAQALRDIMKLGNVVQARGQLVGHTLAVTQVEVLSEWRAMNPGKHFVPRPLQPPEKFSLRDGDEVGAQSVVAADSGVGNADWPPGSSEPAACIPPAIQVCKFMVNTGVCARGDACPFLHAGLRPSGQLRKDWQAKRRRNRREAAGAGGDPHAETAERKSRRAAIFADWLLATFGRERLEAGSGVLDVAGGRGLVAFELQTVRGIRCTVIDPRQPKLSRAQHATLARLRAEPPFEQAQPTQPAQPSCESPTQTQASSGGHTNSCQQEGLGLLREDCLEPAELDPLQEPSSSPKHATAPSTIMVKAPEHEPGGSSMLSDSKVLPSGKEGFAAGGSATGALGGSDGTGTARVPECETGGGSAAAHARYSGTLPAHVQEEFGTQLWDGEQHADLLQGCSLVVGMHPDQATDAIVDFALRRGKSFAVVPCCVFPRLFPHRFLESSEPGTAGEPVSSHAQLVAYLQQRSGGLRKRLPFEGMNEVVYRL